MKPEGEIVEVDVIHWYGQEPDREEIKNSIEAAQKQGWYLKEKDFYAANHISEEKGMDEEHHVAVLFYAERSGN